MMIDNEFCEILEYRISESLSNSENIEMTRCWCDGVYVPEMQGVSSITRLNNIKTEARIDEGKVKGEERGQFKYVLIIKLGEKSVHNFKNELSLNECIPKNKTDDWIIIDIKQKIVEIQLD